MDDEQKRPESVPEMLFYRFRFAAEKLPERCARVLHVEHVASTGFSRCACGKETTPWWHRLQARFFQAFVDACTEQPLGAFELCERCMRTADVDVWLKESLGWKAEVVSTDEEGTTYQWRDRDERVLCVLHHAGWGEKKAEPEAGVQPDLFGDDQQQQQTSGPASEGEPETVD